MASATVNSTRSRQTIEIAGETICSALQLAGIFRYILCNQKNFLDSKVDRLHSQIGCSMASYNTSREVGNLATTQVGRLQIINYNEINVEWEEILGKI